MHNISAILLIAVFIGLLPLALAIWNAIAPLVCINAYVAMFAFGLWAAGFLFLSVLVFIQIAEQIYLGD